MEELKIEVGKSYVDENGDIIKIIDDTQRHFEEKLPPNIKSWLGLNLNKIIYDNYWEDGRHDFKGFSLIREYKEEPKVGWVYESCSKEKWMVCEDKRKYGYSGEYPFVAFNLDENLAPWTGTVSVKGEISSLSILRNYLKLETGRPADEN